MTVIVIVNLGNTLLKRSNDLVESAHSILVRSASFVTLVDRNNGIVTELSSQFFVAKMRKRKKTSKFKKKENSHYESYLLGRSLICALQNLHNHVCRKRHHL